MSINNCFKIIIELVDKQCIKFYNYKILNDCTLNGKWWLCDTLSFENNKYILKVTVCDSFGKEECFTIRFSDAEIINNNHQSGDGSVIDD